MGLVGGKQRTAQPSLGRRADGLRRFVRTEPLGSLGGVIVLAMVLVAVLAPWIAPFGPKDVQFGIFQPPGGVHLAGTDNLGRDIFSRVIWGSRLALYVGLISVGFSVTLGSLWGLSSGYFGGKYDVISQRLVDVLMGFPPIVLALGLMAVLGQSINNVIIALVFLLTPTAARTMRSSVLSLKEMTYVHSALAVGNSHWRVLLVHLVPNALGTYIVLFTVNVAYAIVMEASLSFLGLGTPPDEPSWGGMITAATQSMERAPWIILFPGLAISLMVFGLTLMGDAIRDVTDAKMRGSEDNR